MYFSEHSEKMAAGGWGNNPPSLVVVVGETDAEWSQRMCVAVGEPDPHYLYCVRRLVARFGRAYMVSQLTLAHANLPAGRNIGGT